MEQQDWLPVLSDEAELNKIIDEIFKSRFEFGEDDGMSDVTAVEESDADLYLCSFSY